MTNDLSTLSGALLEMKDELIYQLGQKGVTASYSSSTGLLGLIAKIGDIQTGGGGSCYHIEFQESSYIAVGGSATVSVYLQSNYAPLSGATVSISGSDGSSYTCITNSDGVGTANITCSADITLTASYSNVSDTASVTYTTHMFYDPCTSSSGLSNYAASECVRGSNATMTMEYDSNENAYKVSGSGNYHAMKKINALNGEDNYKISLEVKTQNIQYNNIGLFLDNSANTTSYGLCFSVTSNSHQLFCRQYRLSSDGTYYTVTNNSIVGNTWYRLEFTVNGSSLNGKLYDMNDNLLASKDVTLSVSNKCMGVFMFCEAGSTNSTGWVRNIIVDSL